ncbi:hypothetical protein LCGC14_2620330 [marine sediment metagenome]|uniref:Uncharacterized protein n=1 Tax=marine sediment metagenome TaxID=412755 RepID=A0A0F9AQV1_9ZZZZ
MSGFGFRRDIANSRLDIEVQGVDAVQMTPTSIVIPAAMTSGLTIAAGGLTITDGGIAVSAGAINIVAGRRTEILTVVDDNSQHMTLAAADILAGINVHTSTGGGGNVTCDTAANIIAGVPLTVDGQCVLSYYINDGSQTCTFVQDGGATCTVADDTNTVLINEAAILLWRRVTSSTVVLYVVSS